MSLVLKELNRDVIFQPYYSLTISKVVLFQMDNPPVHKYVHGRIQRGGQGVWTPTEKSQTFSLF